MCNLSELVWERGVSEGMEQGRQDKTRIVVANMLKRGMAEADIMALAECSKEFIKEVMEEVCVSGQQKW